MARQKGGCLPWILGLILVGAWLMQDGAPPRLETEQFDPRSPRRPLPGLGAEAFVIQDPGPKQDSQGTAFAVDRDGVYLTAEHVTNDCDRLALDNESGFRFVSRVIESREADVSLIFDGLPAPASLPLAEDEPQSGETGYHMGFPAGVPSVVSSSYIGRSSAQRGPARGSREPIYVWAEGRRSPPSGETLGGISGGPTFDGAGRVIGVNSASTERRGRIVTTDPGAMVRLVEASGAVDESLAPQPISGMARALQRFSQLVDNGIIRRVYCDVR